MCTVSAVSDQLKPYIFPGGYPALNPVPQPFVSDNKTYPYSPQAVDAQLAQLIKAVLAKLDIIDKKLNLRDCSVQAAEKQAVLDKLQQIIDEQPQDGRL